MEIMASETASTASVGALSARTAVELKGNLVVQGDLVVQGTIYGANIKPSIPALDPPLVYASAAGEEDVQRICVPEASGSVDGVVSASAFELFQDKQYPINPPTGTVTQFLNGALQWSTPKSGEAALGVLIVGVDAPTIQGCIDLGPLILVIPPGRYVENLVLRPQMHLQGLGDVLIVGHHGASNMGTSQSVLSLDNITFELEASQSGSVSILDVRGEPDVARTPAQLLINNCAFLNANPNNQSACVQVQYGLIVRMRSVSMTLPVPDDQTGWGRGGAGICLRAWTPWPSQTVGVTLFLDRVSVQGGSYGIASQLPMNVQMRSCSYTVGANPMLMYGANGVDVIEAQACTFAHCNGALGESGIAIFRDERTVATFINCVFDASAASNTYVIYRGNYPNKNGSPVVRLSGSTFVRNNKVQDNLNVQQLATVLTV
jgi:hypothetical protein